MTAQNMNSGPGYMSYEYREVMVPKEFISIYHNSNSNASGTITITVKEQENEVVEVSYDLLDFMNQQQVQYMEYQLTMTYQNVGKVDSIHLLQ